MELLKMLKKSYLFMGHGALDIYFALLSVCSAHLLLFPLGSAGSRSCESSSDRSLIHNHLQR